MPHCSIWEPGGILEEDNKSHKTTVIKKFILSPRNSTGKAWRNKAGGRKASTTTTFKKVGRRKRPQRKHSRRFLEGKLPQPQHSRRFVKGKFPQPHHSRRSVEEKRSQPQHPTRPWKENLTTIFKKVLGSSRHSRRPVEGTQRSCPLPLGIPHEPTRHGRRVRILMVPPTTYKVTASM